MVIRREAITLLVALVMLLGSVVAGSAAFVADGDPNTIGEALTKPDGSTVTLTCEQVVWCGKSGKSFAVKEWAESQPQQPRLLVVSTSSLPVEKYWSVDITGTLDTFTATSPTGETYQQRVVTVSPSDVQVYCDSEGEPYPFPLLPGLVGSWLTKQALAESPTMNMMSSFAFSPLPTLPDEPDPTPPMPGSRDSIRCLPDCAQVSINGAVVTASVEGRFSIERSDRSFGIWVRYPGRISPGTLVDITGQMATEGGSRTLVASSVDTLATDYDISSPFGMNNKDLNCGLDTTGMTVKVWGNVTAVDSDNRIFFIDDGSHLDDGSGNLGVKIYDLSTDDLPSIDDFEVVIGSSDSEGIDTRIIYKFDSDASYSLLSMPTGTDMVSGTITAAGADGDSIRVYSGIASTTATFTGDAAHYTLEVPDGSPTVTVSMLGYKTTTKMVQINSNAPSPVLDFDIPALTSTIDLVPLPTRTLADGSWETTVIAIARDAEGRRLPNIPVSWNSICSVMVDADVTTDTVGEARAIIRRPSGVSTSVQVHTGQAISQALMN